MPQWKILLLLVSCAVFLYYSHVVLNMYFLLFQAIANHWASKHFINSLLRCIWWVNISLVGNLLFVCDLSSFQMWQEGLFVFLKYTVFHKKTLFSSVHNSVKWWLFCSKFLPDVAEEIVILNIWTKYGC